MGGVGKSKERELSGSLSRFASYTTRSFFKLAAGLRSVVMMGRLPAQVAIRAQGGVTGILLECDE